MGKKICPTFNANIPDANLIEGDIRDISTDMFPQILQESLADLLASRGARAEPSVESKTLAGNSSETISES